jgi:hypothetical protein
MGPTSQAREGCPWFSAFLTARYPGADDESAITRDVLEHYLPWLATGPWSVNTRLLALSMPRVVLDASGSAHRSEAGQCPIPVLNRVAPLTLADLAALTEARVHIQGLALRLAVVRGDVTWETEVVAAHLCRRYHRPGFPGRLTGTGSRLPAKCAPVRG